MATNSSETSYNESTALYVGLAISSLGLLLNILTVFAISRIKKNDITRRQHTYFLLNIMVCDVVTTLAGVLFFSLKLNQLMVVGSDSQPLLAEQHQIRQNLMCAQKMALRMFDIGSTANLFGLLLMSIDHFIVVRFSLKHRILMRKRVVFSLIGTSWMLSALLGMLGLLLMVNKREGLIEGSIMYGLDTEDFCTLEVLYLYTNTTSGEYFLQLNQEMDLAVKRRVSIFVITATFTVMTLVHCYIAVVVIRVSREQQRRLRNSSISAAQLETRMRRSQAKGLCTTILLLGTFTVVWLPVQVVYFLEGSETLASEDELLYYKRIALVTATTTGLLDVAIYFLRSRELTIIMELRNRCLKTAGNSPKSSSNAASIKNTIHTNV